MLGSSSGLSDSLPYSKSTLLIGITLAASGLFLGLATGLVWMPLAIAILVALVPFSLYVVKNPYPLLVFMTIGTYLGSLANLIQDGLIPISPFQLFLVATIFLFLFNRLLYSDFTFRKTGIELELVVFLIIISVSILYSPVHMTGVINTLRMLFLIVMMYLIINLINEKWQISLIFGALVVVSTILAIVVMYTIVSNPQDAIRALLSDGANITRTSVTDIDPNRFASQFLLPIAFVASIMLSGMAFYYRIGTAILLLILLVGVAGTYSRSVMLAALLMLVLIALLYRQYKLFLWIIALSLAVVLIVPDLRIFAANVINRFLDIFAGSSDASSNIRLLLGVAGINMFVDSYMIGVGFGGFPTHFTNYFTLQESIGVNMPHNLTYKILAELGLHGFVVFMFILWKILHTGYRNVRLSKVGLERANSVSSFAAFIALLIFYQFYGGALFDNNFWLLVGLIFAQKHLISRRLRK